MTLNSQASASAYPTLDSIQPDARLTRKQLAQALSERGFVITDKTLATKGSRGGGPPYGLFGKVAIYTWGSAVEWALSVLTPPASNTSERQARLAEHHAVDA